jgi:hypothetical protein
MRRASSLSALLGCLLALQASQSQPVAKLNIVIVEGQGAVNNIRQRTAREPVVQIQDANRRPVAGAAVTFILPSAGPSGVFPNGSSVVTTVTDENGQAAALGLRPNNMPGEFQIRVTAAYRGQTASASISQTNVGTPARAISGKLITVLALAGGAAVGGALVAGRSAGGAGSDGKVARPVITPGTPEVGSPR